MDFHGERRIWDGRLVKQKIKGNSVLYIFAEEVMSLSLEKQLTHPLVIGGFPLSFRVSATLAFLVKQIRSHMTLGRILRVTRARCDFRFRGRNHLKLNYTSQLQKHLEIIQHFLLFFAIRCGRCFLSVQFINLLSLRQLLVIYHFMKNNFYSQTESHSSRTVI